MSIGIVLKTINNEVFNLNVPIDLPIPELKQMVRQSTSIPEDRQRLIYRGHVLQDQSVLNDYKVEDGHTIHMVARPPDYEDLRNQISRREEQNSTTTSVRDSLHSLFALSSLIGDSNNNSNASRTGLGGSRNGNDSNLTPELPTSLEPIRQSLLTTHTLLSTMNCDHGGPNLQNPSIRKYFVGQWLDVKDTVNQWLEATVMQVDLEQCRIFVHYNGWPTRWDEWIVFSSPRLAPFRTRTTNTTISSSCPAPTNTVAHAPLTGRDDIRTIIPEINRLMMTIQPLLNAATLLCDESLRSEVPTESTTPSYAEGMPWDAFLNERDNIGKTSGLSETMDSRPASSSDQELDMKLKDAITDICPLLDRLGRVFTDLSPQIHRYCQPATTTTTPSSTSSASASQSTASNSPTNRIGGTQSLRQGLYPYGALHNRQMRPPSPPPESFFRVPVTNPPRSSNSSGTGSGSHVDIHIHAILTPVRINGGQDPPNSRDELENSTNESEQPSTSENLMSSLFAPLLPSHAQSESSTPPPDQNTFEESDFNSLQPDSLEIQSPAEKDLDLKQSTVSETHHDEEYDYHHHHHHHHPMAAHTESDSSLHSDRNLKKMKTRSPTRVSENTSSDWRSIGKSRERPSSMKKKTETSIPPRSASNQSDSDTSNLSMTMTSSSSNPAASAVPFSSSSDQRNTNSLSTRREMRGLMKAIDTASSSSSSSSPSSSIPSTATSELHRERKDARLSAEKSELSLKSSPKKSSSTQKLESHNSSSSSSSSSLKRTETSESTSRRNLSLPVPQSVPLDESVIPESQQIQSRQASAETSFIQRVRRSLSFRQPQQKQNPKQP